MYQYIYIFCLYICFVVFLYICTCTIGSYYYIMCNELRVLLRLFHTDLWFSIIYFVGGSRLCAPHQIWDVFIEVYILYIYIFE